MASAAAQLISCANRREETCTADLILLELFQGILVSAAALRHGLRTIACCTAKGLSLTSCLMHLSGASHMDRHLPQQVIHCLNTAPLIVRTSKTQVP